MAMVTGTRWVLDIHCPHPLWFGMSHFRQNCTWNFGLFLCFLANYKSWAIQISWLFHVKFDSGYSKMSLKFGNFWSYYMKMLVNEFCLISFFDLHWLAWYFQGVTFWYVGTFFVKQTLMSNLIKGMLIFILEWW